VVKTYCKKICLIYNYGRKSVTKFEYKKCKVVSYGHRLDFKNNYSLQSEGSISVLEHPEYIKYLDVTFNSKLKFDINEKVNKSYSVLGSIYSNFKFKSSDTVVMLYRTLVQSHLECTNCIWSHYRQNYGYRICVSGLLVESALNRIMLCYVNYYYEARFRCLNLPTLKYRKINP